MLKRVLVGAMVAAPLVMASPSFAAPVTLDLSKGFASFSGSGESGMFADYYNFSLVGSNKYQTSTTVFNINNPSFALYSGTYSSGTPTTSPIASAIFSGMPSMSTGAFTGTLSGGSYYLRVAGTGTSADGYIGGITVSAVPLPPALPMFGAALIGLAGYSLFRRSAKPSLASLPA